MSKTVYGLLLGGVLGVFDGLTAWFTPAVRPFLMSIVIGSTIKGLLAGALTGYFAQKTRSLPLAVLFGLLVGLTLAFGVASMPSATGEHYYFQIMLPGSILGAVVGYAAFRYQQPVRTLS